MKKHFKSIDNKIYLDITPHAEKLFNVLDLFMVWKKKGKTYRLPIFTDKELTYALKTEHMHVCIEVGKVEELSYLIAKPLTNLDKMNTITHEGFIYVKYNDISNCE